jgi:hypothetical protein
MLLPRGVTGFNVPRKHAGTDIDDFRADCLAVAASVGGHAEARQQVLDVRSTSFVTQVILLPDESFTALLNKYFPLLGFCEVMTPGDCSLRFIDPGRAADRFARTGRYRVLNREELVQPVTDDMCEKLGRGEMLNLKYWRSLAGTGPIRLGDVVFNFWD